MQSKVICFGEVLWDAFPDGEKVGGAPLNVALRLNSLGVQTSIASQVGNDALGQRLVDFIKKNKLNVQLIQTTDAYATGVVNIHLDKNGSPFYEIAHPAAWDKIEATSVLKDWVKNASLFLFGSLIARDAVSKKTLLDLLKLARFKVFDLNLRPPHYDYALIETLMQGVDFIKFNDEELIEMSQQMGCQEDSVEGQLCFMAEKSSASYICVTKGSDGAVLYHQNKFYEHRGFPVVVIDTVGTGDSFLATVLEGILNRRSLQETIERACAMGALVAGSAGANTKISETQLLKFIQQSS